MARCIGRCSTVPALRHQESRHGPPDDLACRDATRCCVSTQTAREAFRHFERDRNRVLGRQWRRTRSRQFEVAIGLSSRQAKPARQSHGGLRHADLVREQAPRRSQSFGLLHSRRTNHLTRTYYLLRLKSTTHRPRQPTIARSKRKLSFAFREPSRRPAGSLRSHGAAAHLPGTPAFCHLSIILRITPSVTRLSRKARRCECGTEVEGSGHRLPITVIFQIR